MQLWSAIVGAGRAEGMARCRFTRPDRMTWVPASDIGKRSDTPLGRKFIDIPPSRWLNDNANALSELDQGLLNGVTDGTLKTECGVTSSADLLVMLDPEYIAYWANALGANGFTPDQANTVGSGDGLFTCDTEADEIDGLDHADFNTSTGSASGAHRKLVSLLKGRATGLRKVSVYYQPLRLSYSITEANLPSTYVAYPNAGHFIDPGNAVDGHPGFTDPTELGQFDGINATDTGAEADWYANLEVLFVNNYVRNQVGTNGVADASGVGCWNFSRLKKWNLANVWRARNIKEYASIPNVPIVGTLFMEQVGTEFDVSRESCRAVIEGCMEGGAAAVCALFSMASPNTDTNKRRLEIWESAAREYA